MDRITYLLVFMIMTSFANAQEMNINALSSSVANDDVIYALGDIQIDDTSGALGTNSFQLFYEVGVSVDAIYDSALSVYPNPTENFFSIDSNQPIETIKLVDLYGREILKTTKNQNIDLSTIEAGIYIVIINSKEVIKISKQ